MRGLLEALILDSIAREPKHGYALLRELEHVFGATPNRNQVYPMLNRLEKEGFLQADRAEGRGKTRYHLTGKGLELLKDYRVRTPLFAERVQALWGTPAPPPPGEPPREPGPEPGSQPRPEAGPRVRIADEPAPVRQAEQPASTPPPHAAGCALTATLRRQPGPGRATLELEGLDPACPACAPWRELLRGIAGRFAE